MINYTNNQEIKIHRRGNILTTAGVEPRNIYRGLHPQLFSIKTNLATPWQIRIDWTNVLKQNRVNFLKHY